ncbi:MAG: hypothetical protein WC069_07150 [Candidatus Shapirobacteria bacterium]|jgi:hypothetical protein
MAQLNLYSDLGTIAQDVQDDAIFVVREVAQMQRLITVFSDLSGGNPRVGYKYNAGTAAAIGESDDLTSRAFAPSADQTLTPAEIGLQFFITDLRAESEAPENILTDAARELGFAAADKIETDLIGDMASLTGGSIGASGTAITWGYLSAAIAQARYVNKSNSVPLAAVIHEYQWAVLAKAASVAGSSLAQAPQFTEEITRQGAVAMFMGVPIYKVFGGLDGTDFTGGVFPRVALAIDWRRPVRVRAERDESRRGVELNMSAVYAHGIWRPDRGIEMYFDATAPTS